MDKQDAPDKTDTEQVNKGGSKEITQREDRHIVHLCRGVRKLI